MKISELLGKPLISLADSEVVGILKDVVFEERLRRVSTLVLFDDKNEQEEKTVPASAVIAIEDALVIKSDDEVMPAFTEGRNNPILKTVFNTRGKVAGRITDILLDDRLNVLSLELNGKPLEVKEVATFSDSLVIIYDGKRIKINRKPRERMVRIQPIESKEDYTSERLPSSSAKAGVSAFSHRNDEPREPLWARESADAPREPFRVREISDEPEHNPLRIIGNYAFLLGRRVANEIYNQRGDVIVEKNTLITPEVVENARRYGRLVELTLHSVALESAKNEP